MLFKIILVKEIKTMARNNQCEAMQYFADVYLEYDLCLRRFGDLDLLRLRSENITIKVKKKPLVGFY